MRQRNVIAVLLIAAAALCVVVLVRTRVPEPDATARVATPTIPAVQSDNVAHDPLPSTVTTGDVPEEEDHTHQTGRKILSNIFTHDFLTDLILAPRDIRLFRRLLDDPTSATFDLLLALGEQGDPQGTVVLNALDDKLCPQFRDLAQQPDWKRDMREQFDRESFDLQRALKPQDWQNFRLVIDAYLDMAEQMSQQCNAGRDAMRRAGARLPQLADDGDVSALMALADRDNERRETLIGMLHELTDSELVSASAVITNTTRKCDAFEITLGVMRERATGNPAVSAALGRLLTSACLASSLPDDDITHWRAGAYLGDSASARDYLRALQVSDPEQHRIEAFAVQSFLERLNQLGCMGELYFDLLSQQNAEGNLTGGQHLSPYENDVALARSQTLWEQHSSAAIAHHHCVR